eukprot:1096083-Pelagomonas_calceolata.AAC.2
MMLNCLWRYINSCCSAMTEVYKSPIQLFRKLKSDVVSRLEGAPSSSHIVIRCVARFCLIRRACLCGLLVVAPRPTCHQHGHTLRIINY